MFYKTKSGCQFGEKCSYAHRQVDEQPSKRSKKNEQLGCVFARCGAAEVYNDFAEDLKHTEANPMCSIHLSHVTSC